jgi:hypothetical protein
MGIFFELRKKGTYSVHNGPAKIPTVIAIN